MGMKKNIIAVEIFVVNKNKNMVATVENNVL